MDNKIQVLTEKLNRRYRFLTAISLRASFICSVATLDGIFYGLYCGEPWYIVLLDGIAALILAVLSIGAITLIFKPFLFILRLILQRTNKRIFKMEQEKCNENLSQLNKECFNEICENQEQQFQKYSANVQKIVYTKFQIRALEIKRTKYAEWKWVLAAAIILFIGVVIIISIYLLMVLLVLLFVICAFLATHDSGEHSRYKSERTRDFSDHNPFIIELFEKVSNLDDKASFEILCLQMQIQNIASENINILKPSIEAPKKF